MLFYRFTISLWIGEFFILRHENYTTQLILVLNGQTKCWVVSVPFSWRPLLGLRFPLWIAWWVGYKPELCRLKPLLLLLRTQIMFQSVLTFENFFRTNYFKLGLYTARKQVRKGSTKGNAMMKVGLCTLQILQDFQCERDK